jgi:ribonuclease BN (tRNA processing enzyme)
MLNIKFWGTRGTYPSNQQLVSVQIQSQSTSLLVDAGSTRIFEDIEQICHLDAILLTHNHLDHAMLVPCLILARLKTLRQSYRPDACPIYAPEDILQLASAVGLTGDNYFWSAQLPERIGDIEIQACPTEHRCLSNAFKFTHAGLQVAITGDTTYTPNLAPFCHGVDLLICECTDADTNQAHADFWAHMTPRDVARLIRESGAKQTILYHLFDLSPTEAASAVLFHLGGDGNVLGAMDGMEIVVQA